MIDTQNDASGLEFTVVDHVEFLDALDDIPDLVAVCSADRYDTIYTCDGYTIAMSHQDSSGAYTFFLPILT